MDKKFEWNLPPLPPMQSRHIEGLPPIPEDNSGWEEWNYRVLRHRVQVYEETATDWSGQQEARAREIVRVANDGRYWLSTYGAIYEARPPEDDEDRPGSYLPFVPYLFQLYVWDWFDERMRTRGSGGDGVIVKSRDMGLSNMACAYNDYAWMTKRPWQARILSRNEKLVDETGNPDSMFWKIDLLLKSTPAWMVDAFAPGFDWKRHRLMLRLVNPGNGNAIAGESTQVNAGRGGRASMIVLDEAAFMPKFNAIWTATRASSRHRIAISTVSIDEGMDFHNLHKGKHQDRPAILEIPYHLHPFHDRAWLDNEISRDTEAGIRREIFMDYFAGTSEFVYPEVQTKELGPYPFLPYAGPLFLTFDDGFDDYWAMHLIQYIKNTGRHRVIDSYFNSHMPVDFYGSLMTGQLLGEFGRFYGDRERYFASMMAQLPVPTFIGDPHGANTEQIAGMSVFDRLSQRFGIFVNYDMHKRQHKDRRVKLSLIAPMMDFNATEGVEWALHSLKMYRFKKIKEGREQTSEFKQPLHDENSHASTAFEFYAVNFDDFKHVLTGGTVSYGGDYNK